MKKKLFLMASVVLFLCGYLLIAQDTISFKVIVNSSNTTTVLSRKQLSKFFLKKATKWGNGNKILPVDLLENSPVREVFSKDIHKRSVTKVRAYWQKQIFSGRNVPPPQMEYEDDIIAFVEADSGAIGYVSESTRLSEHTVKIIEIKE